MKGVGSKLAELKVIISFMEEALVEVSRRKTRVYKARSAMKLCLENLRSSELLESEENVLRRCLYEAICLCFRMLLDLWNLPIYLILYI